jgi:hypothetical protein
MAKSGVNPALPYPVRAEYHRPKFYRTKIADRRLFHPVLNRYVGLGTTATIGAGVVIGSYAYYVKWANSRVITPTR